MDKFGCRESEKEKVINAGMTGAQKPHEMLSGSISLAGVWGWVDGAVSGDTAHYRAACPVVRFSLIPAFGYWSLPTLLASSAMICDNNSSLPSSPLITQRPPSVF